MASAQVPTVLRTPLTGWLKKRKSEGSKSQFLKSVNKRFFTLDFEGQIFYYSHSEGKKDISMPIQFNKLLGVEPLASMIREPEASGVSTVKTESDKMPDALEKGSSHRGYTTGFLRLPFSSQALLHTIPSFPKSAKRSTEQQGFVLKLDGKSMELLCNSREEAEMWIAGFHAAIAVSQATEKQIPQNDTENKCLDSGSTRQPSLGELSSNSERSTSPPSSHTTSPRSSGHSADGSEQATPLVAPGGTVHDFPPLAPGTPPLHAFPPLAPGTPPLEQREPLSPLGFSGDIVRKSSQQETLPLAPGVSLRATAMRMECNSTAMLRDA